MNIQICTPNNPNGELVELSVEQKAEVVAKEEKYIEWLTEQESSQYSRDRAAAYPSLTDQADMAYWDRKNGTTTLDDAIAAVKDANPKP
mgnify:FL=1